MRVDDLLGALHLPGDGTVNPTDLTQSLAKGARLGGARAVEGVRVTGVTVADGTAGPGFRSLVLARKYPTNVIKLATSAHKSRNMKPISLRDLSLGPFW